MAKSSIPLVALALMGMSVTPSLAADAQSVTDAFVGGTPVLNFRYRFEFVDEDTFDKNAGASTLRSRLGFRTKAYKGLSLYLELENVFVVGLEDYNSTINGRTAFPVIADPETTELNQAYAKYDMAGGLSVKAGREAINVGTQRFIGTVGFRQNDQTFDNATVAFNSDFGFAASYVYVWQVNRIFSSKHPLGEVATDTHLINASYDLGAIGMLSGYGYFLDMKEPALVGQSTATLGARLQGDYDMNGSRRLTYAFEYARQSDNADNPNDFSVDYYSADVGVVGGAISGGIGIELLGSDNGVGFATPLATLHKFNGWADRFLATPGTGLRDLYARVGYKVPADVAGIGGATALLIYRDFNADVGGADYGSEIDWKIAVPLGAHYSASLEGAHYNANSFSRDVDKIWFTLSAGF
jgi:Alginate export